MGDRAAHRAAGLLAAVLVLPASAVATAAPLAAVGPEAAAPPDCALGASDAHWAQQALDNWDIVTGVVLDRPEAPLPWIVLYDGSCTWHLASRPGVLEDLRPAAANLRFRGAPVPVASVPHGATIRLPTGHDAPARAAAFTSLYVREGAKHPFFVLALASLWRRDNPWARQDARIENFFSGVAAHEMTHTLQLVAVERQTAAIGARYDLPGTLSDTITEEHFRDAPGYTEALATERLAFLEAAAAATPAERRRLAGRALELLRSRRARFFSAVGENAGGWSELEDVFLGLEGAAVWTHYRLAQEAPDVAFLPDHPEVTDRPGVLAAMAKRGSGEWVQDEGFFIFLLIDELVPDWKSAAFGPAPPSPVAQLADALAGGDRPPDAPQPPRQEPTMQGETACEAR